MKKLLLSCLLMLACVGMARADYPLTIPQGEGEVTVGSKPERVVVYDLAALDSMDALGIEAVAVAKGYFPDYLKHYDRASMTVAGSLFEPDYEALKALQPDLILVGPRSRSQLDKLSKIAPTLDMSVERDAFVEGVKRNIRVLGQVFDKQEKAQALLVNLDRQLNALRELGRSEGTGLVLFSYKENMIAHADGDRFGMLYGLTGLAPVIDPEVVTGGVKSRPEPGSEQAKLMQQKQKQRLASAMEKQPDWLLILDRGAATGGQSELQAAIENNPAVMSSSAWQASRVFYLNPTEWYVLTGGYRSVVNMATGLAERFQNQ